MKSNGRRPISPRSVAGVAAGLVVLAAAQTGSAAAAPKADGESAAGDIKIHNAGTGEDDNRNEPKVCTFTLVGDNFDAGESLSYAFILGAPFKDAPVLTGSAVADSGGSWSTAVISTLTPGQYKVTVDDGEDEKYKVFKVECDEAVTSPAVDPPVVTDPPADPPVDPPVVTDPPADPPVDLPVVTDPPADPPVVTDPPADPPVVTDPPADPPVDPAGDPDPISDPIPDPDPVAPDDSTEPDGNPVDESDPAQGTEVLLPAVDSSTPASTPATENLGASTPAAGPAATPADSTVTGTWEERSTELPHTGANPAGIGVAGLLLIGMGYAVRRAARSGR